VPRTGLRRRLSAQQRQAVWRIRQQMAAEMEQSKTYTKNYGRLKVLEYLQSHPEDRGIRDIGLLFLDEVQDLNPVALRALRELTRGAMVMAGDGEQSIYSCRSPFPHSGISLRGATRILKTNFRNTVQVYELAERFRRRSLADAAAVEASPSPAAAAEAAEGPTDAASEAAEAAEGPADAPVDAARPFPFREGPPPELYTARSVEELQRLLLEKIRVFLEELGYDAENLCILVPRKCEIEGLRRVLEKAGLELEAIREEQFSFRSTGKVRVSTLHSSKGLDFPVVLLYLPYLSRRQAYDDAQTELLLRNLLYVGITRAMDNVNAFLLQGEDPILRDLAACFGA
jgi:superfamily I DNA/RNA helicase